MSVCQEGSVNTFLLNTDIAQMLLRKSFQTTLFTANTAVADDGFSSSENIQKSIKFFPHIRLKKMKFVILYN